MGQFLSHFRAATGAVLCETREETRQLAELLGELPADAEVCTLAAPAGALKDARTGKAVQGVAGLLNGYTWAQEGPNRVLVVYDWHTLVNGPAAWRSLIEALPGLREPKGRGETDNPSLVVFVGPCWELGHQNPLRGLLPVVRFAPPDREGIRQIAAALQTLNGEEDAVVDALCGLSADAAQQCAAEVLERTGGAWDVDALRGARRQALKEAGLEIWPATPDLGGLGGLREFCEAEVFPWVRDEQLAVRRLLCAGVPGVGKSFCARWMAARLKCECARLSIPALKGGIVGQSEGNLRRALATVDAIAKDSPLVLVLDEIDTVAREGHDGGTSSGMFAELLTWLQESPSQALVLATLNRLDKLDAALESRMQARFFFDLPGRQEREAVCAIHYRRLKCADPEGAARATAEATEKFSSRELAEHIIPSVARLSGRRPTPEVIRKVAAAFTPASKTQEAQLDAMRQAAATLRRANDPEQAPAAGPVTAAGRRRVAVAG